MLPFRRTNYFFRVARFSAAQKCETSLSFDLMPIKDTLTIGELKSCVKMHANENGKRYGSTRKYLIF